MKILLIGEYSSLHWNLTKGLRELGYSVTLASDGDGFRNYPRDIDLLRKSSNVKDTFSAIIKNYREFKDFKGFDIVQIINPCFTTLNVDFNRDLYNKLRAKNDKVFLGAFGDDSYWLKACLSNNIFRYSEFFINGQENKLITNEQLKKRWLNSKREKLNDYIANSCDGIIACLYEYYVSYQRSFNDKLIYIPLPFDCKRITPRSLSIDDLVPLRFFLGINKSRNEIKGTDKFKKVLKQVESEYSNELNSIIIESIAYDEYVNKMQASDIVLDQLYSYSPAMNGLLAMAMGKVLVSGAENEMYELLNEKENHPIINVYPTEDEIYKTLTSLINNKSNLPSIASNSRTFVEKHHNHIKVAQKYLDFWTK